MNHSRRLMWKSVVLCVLMGYLSMGLGAGLNSETGWAQSVKQSELPATQPPKLDPPQSTRAHNNNTPAISAAAVTDQPLSPHIFSRAMRGGVVVFTVLITLLVMSFLSWALLLYKVLTVRLAQRASARFMGRFWEYASLNDLYAKMAEFEPSPLKSVFLAGYDELTKCDLAVDRAENRASEIKKLMVLQVSLDSIGRSMNKAKYRCRHGLERLLVWLALFASAAPFIGLLGTVWGIMNAFEGIAATGSSSLAVVAPGVSEALIATAFGLIAAIPAVVGYNISQHYIKGVMRYIDEFKGEFFNIVERFIFDKLHHSPNSNETTA